MQLGRSTFLRTPHWRPNQRHPDPRTPAAWNLDPDGHASRRREVSVPLDAGTPRPPIITFSTIASFDGGLVRLNTTMTSCVTQAIQERSPMVYGCQVGISFCNDCWITNPTTAAYIIFSQMENRKFRICLRTMRGIITAKSWNIPVCPLPNILRTDSVLDSPARGRCRGIPATTRQSARRILSIWSDQGSNGHGCIPYDLSFFLDPGLVPYVDKASFIFSSAGKDEARLHSPGGETISPNDERTRFYFYEPGFVVFTIESPPSGNWQFHAQGGGEFKAYTILHSRLRVELDSRARAPTIEPMLIELRMREEIETQPVNVSRRDLFSHVTLPDGTLKSLDLFYTMALTETAGREDFPP